MGHNGHLAGALSYKEPEVTTITISRKTQGHWFSLTYQSFMLLCFGCERIAKNQWYQVVGTILRCDGNFGWYGLAEGSRGHVCGHTPGQGLLFPNSVPSLFTAIWLPCDQQPSPLLHIPGTMAVCLILELKPQSLPPKETSATVS